MEKEPEEKNKQKVEKSSLKNQQKKPIVHGPKNVQKQVGANNNVLNNSGNKKKDIDLVEKQGISNNKEEKLQLENKSNEALQGPPKKRPKVIDKKKKNQQEPTNQRIHSQKLVTQQNFIEKNEPIKKPIKIVGTFPRKQNNITQPDLESLSRMKWSEIKFSYEPQTKPSQLQLVNKFQINSEKPFEKKGIVKACLNISCAICSGSMAEKNTITLPKCGHTLHKQCLSQYVMMQLSPPYERMHCPFGQCGGIIKQSYLRQYLSSSLMKKYWQYESNIYQMILVKEKIIRVCSENGCKQIFLIKKGKQQQNPFYFCETSKRKICKNCNVQWHWRIPNCKQFIKSLDPNSNEYNYLKLAKNNNWMQCTKCLNMIQKNEGCVHIKCICGYDFCYNCGGPFPVCECRNKKNKWFQDLHIN